MLIEELRQALTEMVEKAQHPRELAVEVMYRLQHHYGYLSDEALREGARLLGMTTLELEELATFYDFIYRRPVGRFVIHVCDSVICWMLKGESVLAYLCRTLGVAPGETTEDGIFTVVPAACLGYCDHAPAMLINGQFFGPLTEPEIDAILEDLRNSPCELVICR
jgi:NADH-quinone oxidoreductase subunit E